MDHLSEKLQQPAPPHDPAEKTGHPDAPDRASPSNHLIPEATATFVSRLFFFWLTPVVWRARRDPWQESTLFRLQDTNLAVHSEKAFSAAWECEVKRMEVHGRGRQRLPSLWRA